ncbi:MAG: DUF4111 domain-containing protein [Chloroflexi bacterium]|nr:DUF4111 domain-containing protein [Chloroflexota bacterium]
MAQYGWADCPDSVKHQVNRFVQAVSRVVGDNLIGVYLHGSLAMGCFNPARSDLDLLFLVQDDLSPATGRDLALLCLELSAQPAPLELSFVRRTALFPWQYPTPYVFHFSEDWRERFNHELSSGAWQTWSGEPTDPDLAAHLMMIRQRGLCLLGEPIDSAIPDVPRADYVDSILRDFDWALAGININPVYAVLNCCRILWYRVEGRVGSKEEAAVWAVSYLPDDLRPLVRQAITIYRGSAAAAAFPPDRLTVFTDYVQDKVRQLA